MGRKMTPKGLKRNAKKYFNMCIVSKDKHICFTCELSFNCKECGQESITGYCINYCTKIIKEKMKK